MDREFPVRWLALLRSRAPFAVCTVVGSHGSTPQEAGARMAVLPDGSLVGTIGGGCVEADVRRRALRAVAESRPELAVFSLDHDYGWDDGLICGGGLRVLIEPYVAGDSAERAGEMAWLDRLLVARRRGQRQLLATPIRPLGPRMLWADGEPIPTPLGERLRDAVGNAVSRALTAERPISVRHDAFGQPVVGLGIAADNLAVEEVFIEPILPLKRLIIVGAGHVGSALASVAAMLDFEITIVDDREQLVTRERFPQAERLLVGEIPRTLADLPLGPDDYVVVVTRGHRHDAAALYAVISKPAGYLGLIGSRRKVQIITDDFRAAGVPSERIARVYAPIGLDIGSRTVAEIAISIAAQLVAVRSGRFCPESLRFAAGPVRVDSPSRDGQNG